MKTLRELLSGPGGRLSTARTGFMVSVVLGGAWLTYDLVASMHALKHSGITEQWVEAFKWYMLSCGGGYVGGKLAGTRTPGGTDGTAS